MSTGHFKVTSEGSEILVWAGTVCGRSSARLGVVCVWLYLRPVSGCINAGCAAGAAVATAGFGLLTFVLLLANSSRIVCGMSGSNRTPCCEQPRAVRRSDIMTMERSDASNAQTAARRQPLRLRVTNAIKVKYNKINCIETRE